MHRILMVVPLGLSLALGAAVPAAAHGRPSQQHARPTPRPQHKTAREGHASWQQRDTAVYVVSTINVLRTDGTHPAATAFEQRLHVVRYAVFADTAQRDLYFIALMRSDGSSAGALAYQLGWPKPKSLTSSVTAMGIPAADERVVTAFKNDPKRFLAAFGSTTPT